MARRTHARPWWHFSAAEARMHAVLVASALWLVAGVIAFTGTGYRSIFGPLKGADFIQFYTLGHLDARTAPTVLYNPDAFHRLQAQLVPESDAEHYLIVYPPHVTLLFRPLSTLPYGAAALVWAAILIATFATCIWLAWRPFAAVLKDGPLLIAAAAAFPPLWQLVMHGQTTVVPLVAFCVGWLALERRRHFWAGVALGFLLLKPHFALVLAVLVLACREWGMLAGAAVSIGAQVAATMALLGTSVVWSYAGLILRYPELRPLLEPRPEQMHSILALTNRLPDDWSVAAWALISALVIFRTVQAWRSDAPVAVRTGVLVLASVLVNPHVFAYDVVVLAPALVWFAGWSFGSERAAERTTRSYFMLLMYALYVSLLAPTAALVPVQASVIVLGALFVLVTRDLLAHNDKLPGPLAPAPS